MSQVQSRIAAAAASAAIAAVSARRIVGPESRFASPRRRTASALRPSIRPRAPPQKPSARPLSVERLAKIFSAAHFHSAAAALELPAASAALQLAPPRRSAADAVGATAALPHEQCAASAPRAWPPPSARCASVRRAITGMIRVDAQLGAFFNRPLHPVELVNCHHQHEFALICLRAPHRPGQTPRARRRPMRWCPGAPASPQTMSILLPHARPQHARQVRGVLSQQGSTIAREFVGNPAAACHASSLKQAAAFKGFARRITKRESHLDARAIPRRQNSARRSGPPRIRAPAASAGN